MKFFYLIGDNHKQIVFKDQQQNPLFNLNVTERVVENIPTSHIYIATEEQMMMIANSLNSMFGDEVQMKSFSDEASSNSKMITTNVIGKNALYGKENITETKLDDYIEGWKEQEKEGVSIAVLGGFSGNYSNALISSSVFSVVLNRIQESELTMGVDLYVDSLSEETRRIGPHLIPINTILNFPVSVNYLNGYDAIFISDEKSTEDCGVQSAENLHDFYAKTYGVEKYDYRNIFMLQEGVVEAMGDTISELLENNSKPVLIDPNGVEPSIIHKYMEIIRENAGECSFFSLEKNDIEGVTSLSSLASGNIGNTGAIISQMALVVGKPSFTMHLAGTFGVPSIALLSAEKPGRQFVYYKSTAVITNYDEILNSKQVEKDLASKVEHIVKFWEMLDDQIKQMSESEKEDDASNSTDESIPQSTKSNKSSVWIGVAMLLLAAGSVAAYKLL